MISVPHFSRRQWQVIDLIVQAKENQEIANILGLTEGTVKEYIHRVMQALDLHNRTAVAMWAITHGGGGLKP